MYDSNSTALKATKKPSTVCQFLRQTGGAAFLFPFTWLHWRLRLLCLSNIIAIINSIIKAHLERETQRTGRKLTQREFVLELIEEALSAATQSGRSQITVSSRFKHIKMVE